MSIRVRCIDSKLVARTWHRVATFHQEAFSCVRMLPKRRLCRNWISAKAALLAQLTLEAFPWQTLLGIALCMGTLATAHVARAIEPAAQSATEADMIESISTTILWPGESWFGPRACMIPTSHGPAGMMILSQITGSDAGNPTHVSITSDNGEHWSKPTVISNLGFREISPTMDENFISFILDYHEKTQVVLGVGNNVYYREKKFFDPQPPRWTVYTVRDAQGEWSTPRKLEWNDPRGAKSYCCGDCRRVVLPNGDLLMPVCYYSTDPKRSVSTLLCSFDGTDLKIKRVGNELKHPVGRGLLEPQLVKFGDRYYLTIRAEDKRGYVTVSDNGLDWKPQQAWAWDDGEAIEMSTTQQRWLPHSEGLYLVYTRKDAQNSNVFRWRAPLYVAKVDLQTLKLIRHTERIVFPLQGDGIKAGDKVPYFGNFETVTASPEESWVFDAETRPKENFKNGNLWMARIHWSRPNQEFRSAAFGGQLP